MLFKADNPDWIIKDGCMEDIQDGMPDETKLGSRNTLVCVSVSDHLGLTEFGVELSSKLNVFKVGGLRIVIDVSLYGDDTIGGGDDSGVVYELTMCMLCS